MAIFGRDSFFFLAIKTFSVMKKGVVVMESKPVYDTLDCMKLIKKKYPFIPIWVIRRVLYANDVYMHEVGIIDWVPKLDHWYFKK